MEQQSNDNNNLLNGEGPAQPIIFIANELYKVDWNPFVEHRRYITMEGHMEMFNEHETDPDQVWKRLYFRTKDGRFQWFASHCADEHPISDVLLTGAEVRANKEDWTLQVKGGKENADLRVKVPSNVFEKWHQTLLNHSNSSLIDAYIQPLWPPIPHRTNRVLLLEFDSKAVRAGILTQKPSLPYTFMPPLCAIGDGGNDHVKIISGIEALGKDWPLVEPIQIGDETTQLESGALMALLQRVKEEAAIQARAMDIRFRTQDYSVLISIPQNMDITSANEILKMLLDKALGFKNVSIVRQPSLVLYSYDVTTGVVVDLGEHFSIVPVIDEFVVDDAILSVPFGAKQIRDQLRKNVDLQSALALLGPSSLAEELLLRFLVEKTCYVAGGFEEERKKGKAESVELKLAGKNISIQVPAEARFSATEGLFKPKMWGMESGGLHQLINDAIQRCPIDSRKPLYRAIYLSGGTSLLRGLAERLEKELAQLVPSSVPVQVLNSPWRRHSAFLGAHLIASADEFPKCCVGEANLGDYLRQMSTITS